MCNLPRPKCINILFIIVFILALSMLTIGCPGGGGGGDDDDDDGNNNGNGNEIAEFREQFESPSIGNYVPSESYFLHCDEGYWVLGDTVSEDSDCGDTPHIAGILMHEGSKALRLTSNDSGSGCADNIWVALFDTSTVGPLEYNKGFSISLTSPKYISFDAVGELVNPQQHGWGNNCIFPPCYDNVSLLLQDNNGNILAYVLQRDPWEDPDTSKSKYREIFLDSENEFYARDLFQDFSSIPSFNPFGTKIVSIEFKIDEHGWAIIDNLFISGSNSICSGAVEICDDGEDQDCDGDIDCADSDCTGDPACSSCNDIDHDNYFAEIGCGTEVDCDDNNQSIHPDAVEICDDGEDNDCDGNIDCADQDCAGDSACLSCTDIDNDGYFAEAGCGTEIDCNDNNQDIHPGADEICDDALDNDCDGNVDYVDYKCTIAYYPFNGNANDESGNGHHGTVSGASLTSDRFGIPGKAYIFDGVDDVINVPDHTDFHFTSQMTVTAWVKPSDLSGINTIVNKTYVPNTFSLDIIDGNFLFIVHFPGGDWGQPVEVKAQASVDNWAHVVGVFNGEKIYLYVNGVLKASQAAVGTLQDSDRPISIGNLPDWCAYNGIIDEIRLYDFALNEFDILTLHQLSD